METGTGYSLLMNGGQRQPVTQKGMEIVAAKLLMGVVLWSLTRCTPFVCDMQSASLVGKKKIEVTPGVTSIQFARERKTEQPSQTSGQLKGIQIGYGLSDKIDLRLRVEQLQYRNTSMILFSIGPKFMLMKDRIALYVPIWFLDFVPAQTQPTLLFTIPIVKNKIEINPAIKNIISLGGYDPTTGMLVGWKVGLGISKDLSKWAIRPEYGRVYNVNEKSKYKK